MYPSGHPKAAGLEARHHKNVFCCTSRGACFILYFLPLFSLLPFILFGSQILCIIQFVHFVPILLLHFVFFFSLRGRQKGFTSCSPAKFGNFLLPPGPKKSSKATVSLTVFTRLCWNTSDVYCWQFSFLWRRALSHFSISITFQGLFVRHWHSILLQHPTSCLISLVCSCHRVAISMASNASSPHLESHPRLMRCSGQKISCEVSSRCISLLTTAVCHKSVLFAQLLQGALALTVCAWKYTPCIPTFKTKNLENNSFNIKASISSRWKQANENK